MSTKYPSSNSNIDAWAPAKNEYACLVIGDEILSGHVQESNVPYIISALTPHGYALQEVRIVSDAPQDIARHLTELRDAFSFVISLGGLGPTHDDRTMQGYALSFCCDRVLHKEMYDFFMQKPRTTEEQKHAVISMSTMPEAVEVIKLGTGWPLLKIDNCFALPGLPSICEKTVDKLASILPTHKAVQYCEYFVSFAENQFAHWLKELDAKYSTVSIGSYPLENNVKNFAKNTEYARSKITLSSSDEHAFEKCRTELYTYLNTHDTLVHIQ